MDDIAIARALHVLSVVLWIGGVGFVTTALLPAMRRLKAPEERLRLFEAAEGRFSLQARVTTLLAGITGLYMVVRLDLWQRFLDIAFWWMHAMVFLWLLFTAMLFVAEPLFLHRWLHERARVAPETAFHLIERLHQILLILSLLTVFGAVAGSHGFSIFG